MEFLFAFLDIESRGSWVEAPDSSGDISLGDGSGTKGIDSLNFSTELGRCMREECCGFRRIPSRRAFKNSNNVLLRGDNNGIW